MLIDDLHLARITAPVLTPAPDDVLLDAARAYVDTHAADKRIKTNDELQAASARVTATSRTFQSAIASAYAAGLAAAARGPVEWGVRVDLPHPVRKEKAGDVITFGGSAAETMARHAPEIWPGWTPVSRTAPRPSPWLPVEVDRVGA